MKLGDLIQHTASSDLGLIIYVDRWGYTMVKWLDGPGAIEDVDIYYGELEIVSESRRFSKKPLVGRCWQQRYRCEQADNPQIRLSLDPSLRVLCFVDGRWNVLESSL